MKGGRGGGMGATKVGWSEASTSHSGHLVVE